MFTKKTLLIVAASFLFVQQTQCGLFDWLIELIWTNEAKVKQAEYDCAKQEFDAKEKCYNEEDFKLFQKSNEFNLNLVAACKKGDTKICNAKSVAEYRKTIFPSAEMSTVRLQMATKLLEMGRSKAELNALNDSKAK